MACYIDSIDVRGFRLTHFQQLRFYITLAEEQGIYYGNKKYFDKRHQELKSWVESGIEYLSNPDVKIVEKPKSPVVDLKDITLSI